MRLMRAVTLMFCLMIPVACNFRVKFRTAANVPAGIRSSSWGRTLSTSSCSGAGMVGNEVVYVLWTDIDLGGESGGDCGDDFDGLHYHGYAKGKDGRSIEWECRSTDGQTGIMKINGTNYDLTNGRLILVTTKDGQTKVRQLQRAWTTTKGEGAHEFCERLAKDDPAVAEFVAQVEKR